jgi:hypothetical protein
MCTAAQNNSLLEFYILKVSSIKLHPLFRYISVIVTVIISHKKTTKLVFFLLNITLLVVKQV